MECGNCELKKMIARVKEQKRIEALKKEAEKTVVNKEAEEIAEAKVEPVIPAPIKSKKKKTEEEPIEATSED